MVRSRSLHVVAVSLGLSLALLGCPPTKKPEWPTPGPGKGMIHVDAPEVFARERLVRDRQEQEAWLRTQLAKVDTAEFGVQGTVEFKSLFEQSASLGIDATPAGGLAIAQTESAREDLRRGQEIAELEHRIRIAELETKLEAAQEGEAATSAATSAGSAAQAGAGDATLTPATDTSSEAFGLTKLGGAQLPAGVSGATVSPRAAFRDRLALREEIRQEIFEVMLDDAHDLMGNTLYQLKFDTTVLPHTDASAWAVVEVRLQEAFPTCIDGGALEERCQKRLDKLFREAAEELLSRISILKRSLEHQLADDSGRASALGRFRATDLSTATGRTLGELSAGVVAEEIAQISTIPFQVPGTPFEVYARGAKVCVAPNPRATEGGICEGEEIQMKALEVPDSALKTLLQLTRDQRPVSAYAVTPKEAVDRLSLADASRNARQAGLTAGLAAGTVGLKAALNRAALLEASAQSIQRAPLVVGFSHSVGDAYSGREESTIGWILGPRLRWRTGKGSSGFDFRHVTTQETLSAVVSVPAWWTEAKVRVATAWVSEDNGVPLSRDVLNDYLVPLPGDPGEVINRLFPKSREPQAYVFANPWPRLEIGRKGVFTIQGSNLWRNPLVVVGDQLADKTEVLPNMRGLLVTLNRVQAPPGKKKTDPPEIVEVSVWTSEAPEGGLNAGYVELMWPTEAPKQSQQKVGFSMKTTSGNLTTSDGSGTVVLEFELPSTRPAQAVSEVFIEVENAQLLLSDSTGSCLNATGKPKVTGTCRVELALDSLVPNTRIAVKSYRKEGDKKIWHAPIELRVVEVAQ